MALTVTYECLDGSPFPVTFGRDDDVDVRWVIDREHAPTAMTPLAEAVIRNGRAGAAKAYAEAGLTLLSNVGRESPRANGYDYIADEPLPAAEAKQFAGGLRALAEQYGGTRGVWLEFSLPRVKDGCARLQNAPADTAFRDLAEQRAYVWSHTALAGALARHDIRAVAELCAPVVGDDRAEFVAYLLSQGHPNATIDPGVTMADQSVSWTIDHPTLRELATSIGRDLSSVVATAAARREALATSIRAALPDDQWAEFDSRIARLDAFTFVREARARWQLIATGAMRRVVLARGTALAHQGLIDEPDDVFFLRPEEYDRPARRGPEITARRREHERWTRVTPPAEIGKVGIVGKTHPPSGGFIQGAPGAPGLVHGTARVILDLVDADRLEPGDVLVTTMTSPPWTPLFEIASAVVTDSGDALSHVAIAAREYGIPCVVGTHVATALVRDGDSVIVDGDAGTVRVERSEGGGHG